MYIPVSFFIQQMYILIMVYSKSLKINLKKYLKVLVWYIPVHLPLTQQTTNDMNELVFSTEKGKARNKSKLSWADCYLRLASEDYPFELMSDDDLDSIYRIAFDRWAYHLTRQGYIDSLNQKRFELNNKTVEAPKDLLSQVELLLKIETKMKNIQKIECYQEVITLIKRNQNEKL